MKRRAGSGDKILQSCAHSEYPTGFQSSRSIISGFYYKMVKIVIFNLTDECTNEDLQTLFSQ